MQALPERLLLPAPAPVEAPSAPRLSESISPSSSTPPHAFAVVPGIPRPRILQVKARLRVKRSSGISPASIVREGKDRPELFFLQSQVPPAEGIGAPVTLGRLSWGCEQIAWLPNPPSWAPCHQGVCASTLMGRHKTATTVSGRHSGAAGRRVATSPLGAQYNSAYCCNRCKPGRVVQPAGQIPSAQARRRWLLPGHVIQQGLTFATARQAPVPTPDRTFKVNFSRNRAALAAQHYDLCPHARHEREREREHGGRLLDQAVMTRTPVVTDTVFVVCTPK